MSEAILGEHRVGELHDPHLAHHFDSSTQQFSAAKLGMWIFLGTEILLFSGLFCLYAVFRGNHPEVFHYAHQFLDKNWGALNTLVLILSSFTMALAVRSAQTNHRRELILFLGLTLLLAVDFLGIKAIEYTHKFRENLVWGKRFLEDPHPGLVGAGAVQAVKSDERQVSENARPSQAAPVLAPGNKDRGRDLFRVTCAACHGLAGQGMPGLGKDMRGSSFIEGLDDAGLLAFIKKGRQPNDPLNTTGKPMPPKGGNPAYTDQDLMDIIAQVRVVAKPKGGGSAKVAAKPSEAAPPVPEEPPFEIHKSFLQPAAEGPVGLAVTPAAGHRVDVPDPRHDPNRPANAQTFFSIYFLLTGLHGIHVLIGMMVISWLLFRALRDEFGPSYFTPVDLGGLYWHLVDVIWIFLFPLLYLIK